MSRYTWLLDPGHGGIIDGVYQTAGKRSPAFPNGEVLYEGEFNRDIVRKILNLCAGLKDDGSAYKVGRHPLWHPREVVAIDAIDIVDSLEDVSLRKRVAKANTLHKEKKNCIYVSVHANAFGNGRDFNSAKGVCTFHHYKSTTGKRLAESLQRHLGDLTPLRDRGVRSNDSWANFYVLRKTHMPAVLSENGFMTNFDDATALLDPIVRSQIAWAHYSMILEIEENGL
jgi:N-acetylmuramoyl-L-alanine amidase